MPGLEQLYQCPKCDNTNKHGLFITHYKKFHGGFPPGYENVKKVICEKCSEEFLTSAGLKMHRKKKFCNPSQGEKIICCDQCGPEESFKHSSNLIRHYRDVHSAFPPIYANMKKYVCSQCPNVYLEKMSLSAHTRQYHSNKPAKINKRWPCDRCDKTFASDAGKQKHFIVEHGDGGQFTCDICSRKMPSKGCLKYHFKQVHTKVIY